MDDFSQEIQVSVTENIDTLSSDLNATKQLKSTTDGNDKIVSDMGLSEMMTSQLGEENQIDSELDEPTTQRYIGGKTNNIIVEVDNTGRIIYANLQQIKFKTFADFPQPGSDRLIYIDATTNTLYSWDSDAQAYTKLVADVTIPTKLSEFENDGDGDSPFATEDFVLQNAGSGGGTKIIWEVWE